MAGLLPGNGTSFTEQLRFTDSLNHTSQSYQAVVENFELDYRIYLDQQMRPLTLILVSGMLAVVFGFPIFLRSTLITPLSTLLGGVARVDEGDFSVEVSRPFETSASGACRLCFEVSDSGSNTYLAKPLNSHELFEALHQHAGIEWIYPSTSERSRPQGHNSPPGASSSRNDEIDAPDFEHSLLIPPIEQLEELNSYAQVGHNADRRANSRQ